MKKLTLQQRIAMAITFLILIILFGASFGFFSVKYSIWQGESISGRIKENGRFLTESIDLARSAQVSFKTQVQEWKNMLLRTGDPEALAKHTEGFHKQIDLTLQHLKELESLFKTAGIDTVQVARGVEDQQKLSVLYHDALKSLDPKRPETAIIVDKQVKGIDRSASDAIDALVAQAKQLGADVTQADEAAFQIRMTWLLRIFVVGSLIGIAIGVLCSVLVSSSIARQLKALAGKLADNSHHVASAAGQVSSTSQSLAEGSSRQSASLEETSASLEEMSSMTRRNAESAKQAKELADNTKIAASTGSQHMHTMKQAMERIQASSDEMREAMNSVKESNNAVSKIIKTIDEIAFQTNILALNAAVEAARAGESGLGFAVVADEVRNLAQKSAMAARETASKIEASIGRTEAGVHVSEKVFTDVKVVIELSHQVELSLKGINEKSSEVDDVIGQIADASMDQSQGIEQVNTAVTQMDKLTQSNAALADESASASEKLNDQAKSLNEVVDELLTLVDGEKGNNETHMACQPPRFVHDRTRMAAEASGRPHRAPVAQLDRATDF